MDVMEQLLLRDKSNLECNTIIRRVPLEIYVTQCKDLAAVDAKRNRSDPYVKVKSKSFIYSIYLNQMPRIGCTLLIPIH